MTKPGWPSEYDKTNADVNLLAIDAGTSAVKAAMIDGDGEMLAVERAAVPRRDGFGLDPLVFWESVSDVIKAVQVHGFAVDAITVTGQGDGLWGLDAAGNPSGPAYEWNAPVAGAVIRDWEHEGIIEAHYRQSGTVLWAGASAALWKWLQAEHPDQAMNTKTVLWAKDWIAYQLCGVVATDVTDATIPFLDLTTGAFADDAFARLGCQELSGRVPPILPPGAVIGTVTSAAATGTGLREGIPVLMGCIDGAALMYGAAITDPGQALAVLGTTAAVAVIADTVDSGGEPVGATLKLPAEDRYLRFMGANSGTSTLDWYLQMVQGGGGGQRSGQSGPGQPLEDFWTDFAAGKPGVVMLPYLAGERVPFLAPDATGTFLGMTAQTKRADLARAVALGITFSLKHCLVSATKDDVTSLVLSGGGAASPLWSQLVADVTGLVVEVDDRPHVACDGVASLASGRRPSGPERFARFEPKTDYTAEYQEFVELGAQMRPIWSGMQRQGQ